MNEIVTIYHTSLETPIILTSEFTQLLIVENPYEFYRLVCAFDGQINGNDGELSFLRCEKAISPERGLYYLRSLSL